jgi:hypothetical protein
MLDRINLAPGRKKMIQMATPPRGIISAPEA